MKASELIYRLAKGIEAKGDFDLTIALDAKVKGEGLVTFLGVVKHLDLHGDHFEIYGEEQ